MSKDVEGQASNEPVNSQADVGAMTPAELYTRRAKPAQADPAQLAERIERSQRTFAPSSTSLPAMSPNSDYRLTSARQTAAANDCATTRSPSSCAGPTPIRPATS